MKESKDLKELEIRTLAWVNEAREKLKLPKLEFLISELPGPGTHNCVVARSLTHGSDLFVSCGFLTYEIKESDNTTLNDNDRFPEFVSDFIHALYDDEDEARKNFPHLKVQPDRKENK